VGHRALLVVFEESLAAFSMRRFAWGSQIPLRAPKSVRLAGGIGVRLAPESVFGLPWNQCSAWSGIRTWVSCGAVVQGGYDEQSLIRSSNANTIESLSHLSIRE